MANRRSIGIEHALAAAYCVTARTVIKSMTQHHLSKGVATEVSGGFEFADEGPPPASIPFLPLLRV